LDSRVSKLQDIRLSSLLGFIYNLALATGVPLVCLALLLREEGMAVVHEAAAFLQSGEPLPEPLLHIPWLGPWLQEHLVKISPDSAAWGRQLSELTQRWGGHAIRIVGNVGLNALGFGAALLTSFFLFRDGDRLLEQLRPLSEEFGARIEVGSSDQEIPYPFVTEEGDEFIHGELSVAELAQHFPTPVLANVGDEVADGTWTFEAGHPRPLALFDAVRVDFSLRRLIHYTGTDWRTTVYVALKFAPVA